MKKSSCFFTSLTAVMLLAAGACVTVPDTSDYKDDTATSSGSSFVEGFEQPAKGWELGKGCRIVHNAGMNGNPGLVITRTDAEDYDSGVARIRLNVTPGRTYKVSAMYRTEDLDTDRRFILAPAIEFRKNGEYVSMNNPSNRPPKSDTWKESKNEFTATDEVYLILRLFYGETGTICFDDIRVEDAGSNQGVLYPIAPRELLLDSEGTLDFKAFVWNEKPGDYRVIFELNGMKKAAVPDKDNNVRVRFGNLPEGEYDCTACIVDVTNKTVLVKSQYRFRRTEKASRQSYLDEHGRLIVDGKPFMPVGVYYSWVRTEKDLKRIADGGFNFILTYTPTALNIQPELNDAAKLSPSGNPKNYGTEEWKADIRRSLDTIRKYDLKLMGFPADRPELYKHPVLISSYTADELRVSHAKTLLGKREAYLKNYPGLPVAALTDKPSDYLAYSQFVDVLGIDPYPILSKKSDSMDMVREYLMTALRTGKPIMFVPQAFNWGGHRTSDKRPYESFVTPTEEQLRSMVLLPLIYGVKWFCFYSYTTIFERMSKYDAADAQNFWDKAVVPTAKLLRELEPWALSLEKAPEVGVKNLAKTAIDARAFSYNGKVAVVITSCGPGEGKAEIFVPGKPELRSRFGKVQNLGGGKYLFTGKDIASDVLFE